MKAYVEPYLDPKKTADAIFDNPELFVEKLMDSMLGYDMSKMMPSNFPDIKQISQASWEAFQNHMLLWITRNAELILQEQTDLWPDSWVRNASVVLAKVQNAAALLHYLDNL